MKLLENHLRIWILLTLLFVILLALLKYYSFRINFMIPFTYFMLYGFIIDYIKRKRKKSVIDFVQKNYPDNSSKLTAKIFGYKTGVSPIKFLSSVQFGNTDIDEVNTKIDDFKTIVVQANTIVIISLVIALYAMFFL